MSNDRPSTATDIPEPIRQTRSRTRHHCPCPKCGAKCRRDTEGHRKLHAIGDLASGRPRVLEVTYSVHKCPHCKFYFSVDMTDLAPVKSSYTHQVRSLAIRLVIEDGLPYRTTSWNLWRDHRVFVPFATVQNWVEGEGEKKDRRPRSRI